MPQTLNLSINRNARLAEPAGGALAQAQTMIRRVGARLREWARRARSRRELRMLSDRSLADIGCSRSEAEREVRKLFWRA